MFGDEVNITTEGKRHLGAALGTENFKKEFCTNMVANWVEELTQLCEIAKSYPQAAFSAFNKGYSSKFTYFLRTIENFESFTKPVDDLISDQFIPRLFGLQTPLPQYRDLFALNPKDGGLGLRILSQEARQQHATSTRMTEPPFNPFFTKTLL